MYVYIYIIIYIYPRSVSRWSAKKVCAQGFTVAMMEWISIKIPGDLTPKLRSKLRGSRVGRASVPFQQQCPQLEPSTLGRGIQLVLSGSMGGTMEAPWQRPTLMDCRSTIDSLIDICQNSIIIVL